MMSPLQFLQNAFSCVFAREVMYKFAYNPLRGALVQSKGRA